MIDTNFVNDVKFAADTPKQSSKKIVIDPIAKLSFESMP